MRGHILSYLAISMAFAPSSLPADEDSICPVTVWDGNVLGHPFPKENNWYGSEAFAVAAPNDGISTITRGDAQLSFKSFWWTPGYKPGMERDLTVTVENLFDPSKKANVSRPTNAGSHDKDEWVMLVGIGIPHVGCWRITGRYLDQELSFVLRTVDSDDLPQDAT